MSKFILTSKYHPTGDQPEAIRQLVEGVERGDKAQVLLGVTGSGKTFTVANVIAKVEKPTLVISHNKTLAAQLYEEMRGFFPQNAVEYYVSYYDYYQPEAYIPSTGTYIEKDLAINEELDRSRLAATSALLSRRKDVIVVSSVSCIYGMGAPTSFAENILSIHVDEDLPQESLRRKLVDMLYVNNDLADADELGVGGGLELAEGQVHTFTERIQESDDEGADHRPHEQREPAADRAADHRAVDRSVAVLMFQFDQLPAKDRILLLFLHGGRFMRRSP